MSVCSGRGNDCVRRGPGVDQTDSTRIIGQRIYNAASSLLRSGGGRELVGNVGFIHQFINMPTATGTYRNPNTGVLQNVRGCLAAFGHSFAGKKILLMSNK
jgi:hypothetical protein